MSTVRLVIPRDFVGTYSGSTENTLLVEVIFWSLRRSEGMLRRNSDFISFPSTPARLGNGLAKYRLSRDTFCSQNILERDRLLSSLEHKALPLMSPLILKTQKFQIRGAMPTPRSQVC